MRRLALLGLVMAGCVGTGEELGGPGKDVCEGPLGPPISMSNINAMTACCQNVNGASGQAHCLEEAKVPGEIQPFVATCETGGYCIPDSFLETGASKPPATCTAFGGQGVCLSRCIPQVAENEGLLRPDTCTGADELCVPCISPLDNMPTGACDLLELAKCVGDDTPTPTDPTPSCDDPNTCVYESSCPPVIDPAALVACGADAHCVPSSFVTDPAQAMQLAKCEDQSQFCVPDTFIKTNGKFLAPTCNSVAGAEGRCLSTALPAVKAQESMLPQDTCAASEKCTPCYDPLTGASTGACNLSCDTGPTRPAVTFPACCEDRAKCVPTASIPDDQEGNLNQDNCSDASMSLCVPNQILNNEPIVACAASAPFIGDYTGVCLSDCLDFGFAGFALGKGNCTAPHMKCAPCETFGSPTGAPGCPMQ